MLFWGQLFNLLLYSEWFNYHTSIPWYTNSAIKSNELKKNELLIHITVWVNDKKIALSEKVSYEKYT